MNLLAVVFLGLGILLILWIVSVVAEMYNTYKQRKSLLAHIPGINQFIPPPVLSIFYFLNWFYTTDKRLTAIEYIFTKQNELCMKLFGPVFKFVVGTRAIVFVNDVETGKHIASKGSKVFGKPEELATPFLEFFGSNIFLANADKEWRRYRNLVHHAFSDSALENVVPATVTAVHRLIQLIEMKMERRSVFEDMSLLTIDVIGDAGFSYPFEAWKLNQNNFKLAKTSKSDRTLSEHTKNFLQYSTIHALLPSAFLRKYLKIGPLKLYHESIDAFKSTISELITKRRQMVENGEAINHKDILSLILKGSTLENEEGQQGSTEKHMQPLSNAEVMSNLLIYFLAGHETTARALVFAIYLLCKYPEKQKKAQEQIDSVLSDGKDPTYADFRSLTYVQNIMLETLRLYPTAIGLLRELNQDYECKGYTIPKGSLMMFLLNIFTRSEELFENPNDFVPERFEKDNINPFISPSFGVGNRSCIGRKFAIIESVLTLAMLLKRFQLKLSQPDYVMQTKVVISLQPEEELFVNFEQRKQLL